MSGKGVKTRKNPSLSLANRAVLSAKTRKNKSNLIKRVGSATVARIEASAAHARMTGGPRQGTTVVSYKKRVKNALEKIEENNTRHAKIVGNIKRLKKLNDKLKLGIITYDDKINTGNISDEIMDSVSAFLDYIKIAVEETDLDLDIDEENPADYVAKLSEFIDDKLINEETKIKKLKTRFRIANTLLNIFNLSVKEHTAAAKQLGVTDEEME